MYYLMSFNYLLFIYISLTFIPQFNSQNIFKNTIHPLQSFLSSPHNISTYITEHFNIISTNQTLLEDTLSFLIDHSQLNILESFLAQLKQSKIPFKTVLNNLIQSKVKTLNDVYDILSLKDNLHIQVVNPPFIWDENDHIVRLQIFFSHRLDSPGCSELIEHNEIMYSNVTFHYDGYCVMGDEELRFNLDLNLFQEITKIQSVTVSRGKIIVKLDKKEKVTWRRLLKEGEEIPKNMFS